jgi:NADP-dependent 3-hydroxy acid dehydrogenase YdfG
VKAHPVTLITGASQGIGAALAEMFATEVSGVRLALVARNEKNLARVAARCRKLGATAETFGCDVTDDAAVTTMVAAVKKRFGAVEVLINNAGKFAGAPFATMPVAQFDALLAANLRCVFLVSQAFAPAMIARKRGDIFNISSIAGLTADPGGAGYAAAKAGVIALSRVMRAELREHGVRVCCVLPGATWTPSWLGSGVARERMMPAKDIARAVLDAWRLSRSTVVEEIILRPLGGDI